VLLEWHCSWIDWLATPPYMQQVLVDVIQAKRQRDADDADQRQREHDKAMRQAQAGR